MKITKTIIDKMNYNKTGNRQDIRWDDDLANFGVRIYPSGKKSFVLSYRVAGRKHIMVLGQFGVITLQQARSKAREERCRIEIDGSDPLKERSKMRNARLVSSLCSSYLTDYARPHKKSWKDDERRINKRIIPSWGNLPIIAITRDDITQLHTAIGKDHPYEANRVVELLAKMFSLAQDWGYVDVNVINPAHSIKAFKEIKRDRWVTHEELPALAKAIDKEKNIYARSAVWLYMLTGMRKKELLRAKWTDINWKQRELCIPDTKNGLKHYIPLTSQALEVLSSIPKVKDNPYIIIGLKPSSHLVNIDKPWQRIRKSAGLEDIRLHDLRRTVGSWLAQSGSSLHLIGRVLGHVDAKSTQVYAHFAQDHIRGALEDHGNKLMAVAKENPSMVIAIN